MADAYETVNCAFLCIIKRIDEELQSFKNCQSKRKKLVTCELESNKKYCSEKSVPKELEESQNSRENATKKFDNCSNISEGNIPKELEEYTNRKNSMTNIPKQLQSCSNISKELEECMQNSMENIPKQLQSCFNISERNIPKEQEEGMQNSMENIPKEQEECRAMKNSIENIPKYLNEYSQNSMETIPKQFGNHSKTFEGNTPKDFSNYYSKNCNNFKEIETEVSSTREKTKFEHQSVHSEQRRIHSNDLSNVKKRHLGNLSNVKKGHLSSVTVEQIASWLENVFGSEALSSMEEEALSEVIEGCCNGLQNQKLLASSHALLHSLWQRLHTGHWSDVPVELRIAYTWGSIAQCGLLLLRLMEEIAEGSDNLSEIVGSTVIVQSCDRGLLMGKPIERNPLNTVAFMLNNNVVEAKEPSDAAAYPVPVPPSDVIPAEALPFEGISALETMRLPSAELFLIKYMEEGCPLKILGVADNWPALSTWNPAYFYKMGGARTVPVELGLRYSDSEWSQTLMTLGDYLTTSLASTSHPCNSKIGPKMYLAQHQLFDQMPEFLEDIMVPDYCHMGERESVLNAWIGPEGTVTPLHYDPDHNILVQVYGYKAILVFPESDTKFLYSFEDELLHNTSRVNLEDEVKKKDPFESYPLMRKVGGYYLTLGPGEALYIPPKWWHYVRSLSNSISVSFWWR